MSAKVLIVCDAFPPDFAPRIGNLCKYLPDKYDVTIVTVEPISDLWPVAFERKNFRLLRFNLLSYNGMDSITHRIADYLFSLGDRQLYRMALKTIGNQTFDVVLCTSCYIFPLRCAQKLAAHFCAPLCIDLRDIMEQDAKPVGINKIVQFAKLRWLNQLRRNRILKCAETVTTISLWHVATLSRVNPNTQLIYNGFDAEKFAFKPVKTDKFIVTYTGRLLDINLRDPRLFLEAVSQLCQDETFAKSICIRWFVDAKSAEEIAQLTSGYGLDACTEISKTVSADLMPDILNSSSLVLVLSNKATKNGPHGIMTTKFFEAVGCEKPVLCVRSDDDCLAATIGRTNAGLAGSNVTDVKDFITEKYNEWKSVGYTHQPVNQDEKIKFTRQAQALQFAAVIDKAIRQ